MKLLDALVLRLPIVRDLIRTNEIFRSEIAQIREAYTRDIPQLREAYTRDIQQIREAYIRDIQHIREEVTAYTSATTDFVQQTDSKFKMLESLVGAEGHRSNGLYESAVMRVAALEQPRN